MQDPPGTLNCRCRHEELTRRDPMVDERVIAIVRLLGLERLHMVPSIKLNHALITAFVERRRLETHSFDLPHGEMTITLQDVEVIMGMPIEGEAMVGFTKKTWKSVCNEMLGIQIPDENKTVLDGQRIQIKALVDRIAQLLPPDANELQVHQYARCYVHLHVIIVILPVYHPPKLFVAHLHRQVLYEAPHLYITRQFLTEVSSLSCQT